MHTLTRTTTRLTSRLSTVFGHTVPSPGFSREFGVKPRFALTVEKHEGNQDRNVDVKLQSDTVKGRRWVRGVFPRDGKSPRL